MPKRIQLKRAKGWRMPACAKKVDRSTRWGNPFNATQIGATFQHAGVPAPIIHLQAPPSLDRCLDMYVGYLRGRLDADPAFLEPLRGHDLACWCSLNQNCHADILLRLANETEKVRA